MPATARGRHVLDRRAPEDPPAHPPRGAPGAPRARGRDLEQRREQAGRL